MPNVCPICHDHSILKQKAKSVTPKDLPLVFDLLATLSAHQHHCVGMAANMIGSPKAIIAVEMNGFPVAMINPTILERSDPYMAEEGCLSLDGMRSVIRFNNITLTWQDTRFDSHKASFSGFTAQIIQHEIDHLNGIII